MNATDRLYEVVLSQGAQNVRRALISSILNDAITAKGGDIDGRLYLNVGHTGLDKVGHSRWLQRSRVRPIYFVHDLIPITHPEFCRVGEPEKHYRRIISLLRHGKGLIGNSVDTLNELAAFAQIHIPSAQSQSVVAPLGLPVMARPSLESAFNIPSRPYFILLGTIEGRKNHLLMLSIWAELSRRLGEACPQLIIIGQRGWECEQAVDLLERSKAIQGNVVELSRCDDTTLSAYMRGARALLFPSFVEGYGLPLVEALAVQTPVLASDLAVFRELAGSIPDYFSPIDGLGWMAAIEDYSRASSQRREAQILRLRDWHPPSWPAHFNIVDPWLETVIE